MLDLPLTHPDLLHALAAAGHGAKILVADGHYPLSTASSRHASRIYLNVRPGLVDATSLLESVAAVIEIEAVTVMRPEGLDGEPPIWERFRNTLRPMGANTPQFEQVDRHAFYQLARESDLAVAVATGETEVYANLLLTIGVRRDLDTRS